MGCGASSRRTRRLAGAPLLDEDRNDSFMDAVISVEPCKNERSVSSRKAAAIRDAFDAVDKNRNGVIGRDELDRVLDMLESTGHDLNEEEHAKLFEDLDKDHNAEIRYDEFVDWIISQENQTESLVEWTSHNGIMELHQAAMAGNTKKVESLLASGARVNICDVNDVTPLHYACRRDNVETGKVLIEARADLSMQTKLGRVPLHAAADRGSIALAKLLLESKADIEAKDARLQTPLHWAVRSNQAEVVKFLFEARASLNATTIGGYTPLRMAEDWSTAPIRDLLSSLSESSGA